MEPNGARIRAIAARAAAAALVLVGACKKHAAPPTPPPPEVAVVEVQPQRVPTSFEFTGEVQPYRRVEVRARVEGVIEARPFSEGSVVKPGQILYRLDRVRPEAAYQTTLARANNAKRTLERLQPLVKEDVRDFAQQVQAFGTAINQLPTVQAMATNFRANVPQVYVDVDRITAKSHGVSLTDLFSTLQTFLSTLYINDFNLYGRTYRVQAEAQPQFRRTPDDIGRLYVRGRNDEMIPVSSLVRTEFRSGPTQMLRFNGFGSALFTGTPKQGRSSGEEMAEIDRLVSEQFESQGVGVGYSGQSFQERAGSGQAGLVFGLGLVIVFLVLAAQYESWSIPFAVLLGVPFGALGALLGVWLRGLPSDIYFQVGLITVVGLAAKNAILIVEFANEIRGRGVPLREAAVEAARERFRPILMTSFAFILGVSPLVIASGAGAGSRHSLGTGVFAGMLFATTIGIFFIPLFFRVIRGLAERGWSRRAVGATEPLPTPASPESR